MQRQSFSSMRWFTPSRHLRLPGPEQMKAVAGTIECYVVYVDAKADDALPKQCCTLSTTLSLRELIIRSAALPMRYDENGIASRVMALLLDEIVLARPGHVHLPLPADKRLRKLVAWIMAIPSATGSLDSWAQRMEVSPRTLSRLISKETGLSFGRWRRQLHILLDLQWMTKGATVQDVADGLGYENAATSSSCFVKFLAKHRDGI